MDTTHRYALHRARAPHETRETVIPAHEPDPAQLVAAYTRVRRALDELAAARTELARVVQGEP